MSATITAADAEGTTVRAKLEMPHGYHGVWVSPSVAVNAEAGRCAIAYFEGPSHGREFTLEAVSPYAATRAGKWLPQPRLKAQCWILDGYLRRPFEQAWRLQAVRAEILAP